MTDPTRDEATQGSWGPYRPIGALHRGRSACTYLAVREADGVLISLKLLQPFADVKEQRHALIREAALQGRCRHPAVVHVLEAGRVERGTYIAREYVDGLTLAELCQGAADAGTSVPEGVVAAIGDALLSALTCVHGQRDADGRVLGLMHRDVTPANVLVGWDGAVRLTDFGLAHAPALHGMLSEDEIVQGTPRYLPPEAARGEPPDARADLFQLAACLVELLGVELRRSGTSLQELAVVELPGAALRNRRWGVVLLRALAPQPKERFASAAQMARAWSAASGDLRPRTTEVAEWLSRALASPGDARDRRVEGP